MFFILVSGALSVTFIPVFNKRLAKGNRKSAWELSSSMVNFMALVTLIASVLIIIFADPLVRYVVGPGLDESGRALAISMMRIIAVNPFLFAVATVIASMQQAVAALRFTHLRLRFITLVLLSARSSLRTVSNCLDGRYSKAALWALLLAWYWVR
jgi:peptidoglycan biosynthesis protein MviN/MurJ (putative lipid II flippase)